MELAVRAVVQAEDISVAAASDGRARAVCQAVLRMLRDRLHSGNQPLHRPLPPVTGNQRPHHRAIGKLSGCGNDAGISHSKGRTKPLGGVADRIRNGVVAEAQLNADLCRRLPQKVRVRLRVISNGMSACDGFFHQIRTFTHVAPNQEKCRSGIVLAE